MQDAAMRTGNADGANCWLPTTLEEITPAWLSYALSESEPGAEVVGVKLEDRFPGTCTKVRVRLEYAPGTDRPSLPRTVIVKGGFGKHDPAFNWINLHETQSYRDVLPTLDVNAPRCFFAGTDWRLGPPEFGESMLVIEDLDSRPVTFGDAKKPFTYGQAAAVLDIYARMHARWWNSPDLGDEGRFKHIPQTLSGDLMAYFEWTLQPEIFEVRKTFPRGVATSRVLLDPAQLGEALKSLQRHHRQMPLTIVHGDGHGSNVFFEQDGRAGMLDIQMKRAPWVQDISYFLGSSLDVVDRRNWEKALLAFYLDRLADHGGKAPHFEEAWLAYKRELFYGFLAVLLNANSHAPEEFNTCTTVRFGLALMDHDSLQLLT